MTTTAKEDHSAAPGASPTDVFPAIQPPGSRTDSPSGSSPLDRFGYLPTPHGSAAVLPGAASRSAFRIHEVGRDADRSPWRGRRFAFAAASAVSLAAIALGGALPTDAGPDAPVRAEGAGSNVTPLDADARAETRQRDQPPRWWRHRHVGRARTAARTVAAATPFQQPNGRVPALLGTGLATPNPFMVPVLTNVSAPPLIRPDCYQPPVRPGARQRTDPHVPRALADLVLDAHIGLGPAELRRSRSAAFSPALTGVCAAIRKPG